MRNKETIFIVDDDADVRHALKLLLTSLGHVVRTYSSARDFLAEVGPEDCGCLLTDIRMPGMSGVDLLMKMKESAIKIPVVVMTAYADVPLAIQVMKEGAIDLIQKPFTDATLLTVVNSALAHENDQGAREAEVKAIQERLTTLTPRERDVLNGLLAGRSNKIIAHNLGIGVRTVETHRGTIMEKMQAESFADLVRMSLIGQFDRR
ncbi:response regulator [Methylocystis sp. WRRC1]|uniref:response regulator transcription factor n=1 Tax=Methylocystis sp. WRRC1 TaxID=1732014 RepID=UPI001D157FEF|nr:response regulator [Methylocystis sp. WRRC1]MCC3246042.1 response regulator [Methylocystis sp. WRRC1]